MEKSKAKKKKTLNSYNFKCTICSKKFSENGGLRNHMQTHSPTRRYSCEQCPYKAKTAKYVARHVKKVHSKPTGNPCDICGKMFHFKSGLLNHMLVHTGAKPYKCEECGKAFNSKYSLSTHNLIHQNLKPYQCSMCEYACRDSSSLRKHQDRHLGQLKLHPCACCDKVYRNKPHLVRHMKENHAPQAAAEAASCDVCGKLFKSTSTLNAHVKIVHARLYVCECEVCGATSTNKYNLKKHMMTHVDVRPFRCGHASCGKTFKTQRDVKKHSLLHYPERQYPCATCGGRFARRERLERHVAQHAEGVGRVECAHCGARFYNKNYLRRHIRSVHPTGGGRRFEGGLPARNEPGLAVHPQRAYVTCTRRRVGAGEGPACDPLQAREEECCSDGVGVEIKEEKVEPACSPQPQPHHYDTDPDHQQLEVTDRTAIPKSEDSRVPPACAQPPAPPPRFDAVAQRYAERCIQRLLDTTRRRREASALEEARRAYNERIRRAIANQNNDGRVTITLVKGSAGGGAAPLTARDGTDASRDNGDDDATRDRDRDRRPPAAGSRGANGGLTFNTHQCYVCYQLFQTKPMLLEHCRHHFDVCSDAMLKKCPLCDHVTRFHLARHLRLVHKLRVTLARGGIRDKKENANGSRYYYETNNKQVSAMEVIPSVKNLNKRASVAIDKKKREETNKNVAKTKLVKKGGEWIVEKEKIEVNETFLLPKFASKDIRKVMQVGDDYIGRMKKLSALAKKNGVKMLFPCERCEKMCQTVSALRLHARVHESNPKPFRPKAWRHKCEEKPSVEAAVAGRLARPENRYADPKPIEHKHKCDPKLREFYEENIKGGDVEFWQFLKIYNKMSRENIEDFTDLEKSTDFGIHYPDPAQRKSDVAPPNTTRNRKIKARKASFTRVVKLSRKECLKRRDVVKKLRESMSLSSNA